MLTQACSYIVYTTTVLSLFLIDYLLGNGFVAAFHSLFSKVVCDIRKYLADEQQGQLTGNQHGINLPVLGTEILVLVITIMFLNKYKQRRGRDRIDDLLQDSREALRQTNEFLEKWRLRRFSKTYCDILNSQGLCIGIARLLTGATWFEDTYRREIYEWYISTNINWQTPSEYSYLDEEPQEIKPLKLEVPILHMAIIDTLGSTRNRTERGDAGDMINFTDSTLLSMTSLLEDDLQSIPELPSDEKLDLSKDLDMRDRYLWDVLEEDASLEDL